MVAIRTVPYFCSNCQATTARNVKHDKLYCAICDKQLCGTCAELVVCKECVGRMKPATKQRVAKYQKVLSKTHLIPVCLCFPVLVGIGGFILTGATPSGEITRIVLLTIFWATAPVAIVIAIANSSMKSELRSIAKPLRQSGLTKKKKVERANPEVDFDTDPRTRPHTRGLYR